MIDLKKVESAQQSAQRFNEAITKASHVSFERGYENGYADGLANGYKQGKKDAQPEIIYCKDCKYYVLRALFGRSYGLCERLHDYDRWNVVLTESDDFCSHAERRKQ